MQLIVWGKETSAGPLIDGLRSLSPASLALKGIDAPGMETLSLKGTGFSRNNSHFRVCSRKIVWTGLVHTQGTIGPVEPNETQETQYS